MGQILCWLITSTNGITASMEEPSNAVAGANDRNRNQKHGNHEKRDPEVFVMRFDVPP